MTYEVNLSLYVEADSEKDAIEKMRQIAQQAQEKVFDVREA